MSEVSEKKRCLIIVQGGVANFIADEDVEVCDVDLDLEDGEDQFDLIPESFSDLVACVR